MKFAKKLIFFLFIVLGVETDAVGGGLVDLVGGLVRIVILVFGSLTHGKSEHGPNSLIVHFHVVDD